jgi:hypothetical protein
MGWTSAPTRRASGRLAVIAMVAGLALAACGSGSPAATAGPTAAAATPPAATAVVTPAPTATEASQPTGPATFQLAVEGEANVAGTWQTGAGINCSNPTLAGLNILAFATSPDGQAIVVLTITAGQVNVSERAGSGATYTAREFTGTGVTGYDPARGATIDSDVVNVPTPEIKAGTLGTITHVTGSVDCGGQTTGTSTVVASGSSAEGPVEGPFTQFRVICNDSTADGLSANVVAVIDTTTPPVYLIMGLPANGNATIFTITDSPTKQHSYAIDKAATSGYTVSATGVHLDGDFIEVVDASAKPHVIHLEGDGTCGTFNKSE